MLRLPLLLISVLFIAACHKPSGIKNIISGSDSVAVSFYTGDGTIDSVTRVVILRQKEDLEKLAGYIESDQQDPNNCGYDGALHFFKNSVVSRQVYFRMNNVNCMHFSFMMDNKAWYTRLSPEAKQYLEQVKKR
ncbi:MAG: hypothetical protein U0X40_09390 [Ferruginibacter sp.]